MFRSPKLDLLYSMTLLLSFSLIATVPFWPLPRHREQPPPPKPTVVELQKILIEPYQLYEYRTELVDNTKLEPFLTDWIREGWEPLALTPHDPYSIQPAHIVGRIDRTDSPEAGRFIGTIETARWESGQSFVVMRKGRQVLNAK